LAWHQDRVVAVRERKEVEGFGPWTRKHGALHVAPPFDVLARMLTLRVHLDPASETNAPLLVAPGSHRMGRVPEADIPTVVSKCGVAACLAEAGDVWTYATPILHASERASVVTHRRVLQVDYAVDDLPGGLQWLGV
jgi:ectoine hydroxylase-related dioxygenase (phytanoyl-CoA dioxygenase family)